MVTLILLASAQEPSEAGARYAAERLERVMQTAIEEESSVLVTPEGVAVSLVVSPPPAWIVRSGDGVLLDPLSFALLVGDAEGLAAIETETVLRRRRGVAWMVVGLGGLAGGVGAFAWGGKEDDLAWVLTGLVAVGGGSFCVARGISMRRTLPHGFRDLSVVYTGAEVDGWIAAHNASLAAVLGLPSEPSPEVRVHVTTSPVALVATRTCPCRALEPTASAERESDRRLIKE